MRGEAVQDSCFTLQAQKGHLPGMLFHGCYQWFCSRSRRAPWLESEDTKISLASLGLIPGSATCFLGDFTSLHFPPISGLPMKNSGQEAQEDTEEREFWSQLSPPSALTAFPRRFCFPRLAGMSPDCLCLPPKCHGGHWMWELWIPHLLLSPSQLPLLPPTSTGILVLLPLENTAHLTRTQNPQMLCLSSVMILIYNAWFNVA